MDPAIWVMLLDETTARGIAANPYVPPMVLEFLIHHPNARVRTKVAGNEATDPHLLEILAADEVATVREAAIRNPITPDAPRTIALRDRAARVRAAAQSQRIVMNWDVYRRTLARMRFETAEQTSVVDAIKAVALDIISQYATLTLHELEEINAALEGILAPLHDYTHEGLSLAVTSELTEKLSSHRLATAPNDERGTSLSSSRQIVEDKVLQQVFPFYTLPTDVQVEMRRRLNDLLRHYSSTPV